MGWSCGGGGEIQREYASMGLQAAAPCRPVLRLPLPLPLPARRQDKPVRASTLSYHPTGWFSRPPEERMCSRICAWLRAVRQRRTCTQHRGRGEEASRGAVTHALPGPWAHRSPSPALAARLVHKPSVALAPVQAAAVAVLRGFGVPLVKACCGWGGQPQQAQQGQLAFLSCHPIPRTERCTCSAPSISAPPGWMGRVLRVRAEATSSPSQ